MENVSALFDVQGLRNLAACMLARLAQNLGRVSPATTRDFVRNILHFENM